MEDPINILLVEDNPIDVLLVKNALKQEGLAHRLTVATDGEQALELINSSGTECPDVILLDLNLPRVSGAQVLQRLRQGNQCVAVPVIICTSSNSPADRAQTTLLGANRYFLKP